MSFYSHLVKSSVIFKFFFPPVDIAHLPHVSLYVTNPADFYRVRLNHWKNMSQADV